MSIEVDGVSYEPLPMPNSEVPRPDTGRPPPNRPKRGIGSVISDADRKRIVELYDGGETYAGIARETGWSQSAVRNVVYAAREQAAEPAETEPEPPKRWAEPEPEPDAPPDAPEPPDDPQPEPPEIAAQAARERVEGRMGLLWRIDRLAMVVEDAERKLGIGDERSRG